MKRLMAFAAGLVWTASVAAQPLPSFDEVRAGYKTSDILVLDRHGELLQRVRADFDGRRGDWVALEDVSPALIQAVLESEDRRFFTHHGVDVQALAAAAWGATTGSSRRGASTLTMQLAGLLEHRLQRPSHGRGLSQKLEQIIYAQALERRWNKNQILEAYLNLVPFRGELIGVDALSQVLFRKYASGLDGLEAAVAAVMLRGPNVAAAVLASRACSLLKRTTEGAHCVAIKPFVQSVLKNRAAPAFDRSGLAPHFARWVTAEGDPAPGQRMETSLDATLQRRVLQIVDRHIKELQRSRVRDAAVVVLDNASGQILAYVGSSGALSDAAWVDHVAALRQAGSTLKPFLYQQAIEQQRLTTVSLLDDSELNVVTGNGLYVPRNYDDRFAGWLSVRTALASSLNIPAVRALGMVSPDAFRQRLVELGLPLTQPGDYYGLSLALGSADVSLLTLTNAYRALARGCLYGPVHTTLSHASDAQRVMDARAAWIIGDVLSDPQARARTFGLDGPLTTRFWTAVKTGTSKDMRDNWTIGWSERYTVGVWAGNSSGESMRDVSGVTGAGPIWHETMMALHEGVQSQQPEPPPGTHAVAVRFQDDVEPARTDYFIEDTAVEVVRPAVESEMQHHAVFIAQPANGTVVALDPDIPPAHQRLVFRASVTAPADAKPVYWRVDEEEVTQGREMLWLPTPGRHRIELLGEEGQVLDSVALSVRGAVPAPFERETD